MAQTDPIHSFNLFGESTEMPDVMHCERISTRSLLHNWEFKPHRHGGLHQIFMIESGGGEVTLDGQTRAIVPAHLINVPKGVVHGFRFDVGTQGWVVTLTSELVDQLIPPGEGLENPLSQAITRPAPKEMAHLMRQLFKEHEQQGFGRAQILRGQASVLLGRTARCLARVEDHSVKRTEVALFRRFEAELEQRYRLRPQVSDLASALSVTPTHLSRITRAVTGQPASHVVAERVSREARRLLVFTNLNISEIAYALGYQDPAHFSRVFKLWVGKAPRQFREEALGRTA